MRIVLTGGGTLGSVMPLLAIVQRLKANYLFIGTRKGIEEEVVKKENIKFKSIFSGKLRRYFSFRNFVDPFLIFLGFLQSIFILKKFKPDLIIGAGGFVSLPVIIAGFFLKIPSLIHQQDIRVSLTNKILAPFASRITTTFKNSIKDFPSKKTIWTGNIVRKTIFQTDKERARKIFNLKENLPTVLIIGGGTGALSLNKIVAQILPKLLEFSQVIHLIGKGKRVPGLEGENYHGYEFIDNIEDAYAISDLVISRAGMSALSELSTLKKPTILIPLPETHQEENAKYLEREEACIYLKQESLTPEILVEKIKELLQNKEKSNFLGKNLNKVLKTSEELIEEIKKLV